MRYAFPHYRGKAEYVQPNPQKWNQIREGMNVKEVVALLGPPLDDPLRGGPRNKKANCYYYYGHLALPFTPHPRTYSFLIYFGEKGKLMFKEDPFAGAFSVDGVPTKPIFILPRPKTSFSHYPRVVDVRWHPPAGEYPMKFEIEVGHGVPGRGIFDEMIERELKSVYYCFNFCGTQPGRLRVRARNGRGVGPWSEFAEFEFTC